MSAQRYQRIAATTDEQDESPHTHSPVLVPHSPPPSFRSGASSGPPSRAEHSRRHEIDEARDLNDAFDAPSDDEGDDGAQDQRRLISDTHPQTPRTPTEASSGSSSPHQRIAELPRFTPTSAAPNGRVYGGCNQSNDGVFANLNAKQRPGEDGEEKPPTYEQAAADATPPYWETTVLSPYTISANPDDVFVDGLLVGSLFSFVWNALISMSFQLIGFLLTYLLHTTHAAKNGSRLGLGVTFIQYGFQMRYAASKGGPMGDSPGDDAAAGQPADGVPEHPNSHKFDPNTVSSGNDGGDGSGISATDWLAYVLMVVGWFILIRSGSDYLHVKRQEQLIRMSPDRGLGVAIVAEGEDPERSV